MLKTNLLNLPLKAERQDMKHDDIDKCISREDWDSTFKGYLDQNGMTPLVKPIDCIVTTWTDTDGCHTTDECKDIVRNIHRTDVEKNGFPDIQHNFLVGADGYVYEGRGWLYQGPSYPEVVKGTEKLAQNRIQVAFIEKNGIEPPDTMVKALSNVITLGIAGDFFKSKLKFFCKTGNTISLVQTHDLKNEKCKCKKKASNNKEKTLNKN